MRSYINNSEQVSLQQSLSSMSVWHKEVAWLFQSDDKTISKPSLWVFVLCMQYCCAGRALILQFGLVFSRMIKEELWISGTLYHWQRWYSWLGNGKDT